MDWIEKPMIKDYFILLRPLNCVIAALAIGLAAYITVGNEIFRYPYSFDIMLAMLVGFLFTAAGNALNDYYDRFVDKVNHPERPIPAGKIRPEAAIRCSAILFGLALFLSLFINLDEMVSGPLPFVVVTLCFALMISYELFFKVRGFEGNVVIAVLTATLFLFGGVAMTSNIFSLRIVLVFAAMAFFATLGRELVKDIEDIKGDYGHRITFPMKFGKRRASVQAATWFGLAIASSPLPYLLGLVNILYLPAVLCADAMFIYCIVVLFSSPERAVKISKLGMVLALAAFMVGKLLPAGGGV